MTQTLPLIRLGGGNIVLPFEGVKISAQSFGQRLEGGQAVLGFVKNSKLREVGVLAKVYMSSDTKGSDGYVLLRALRRVSLDQTVVGHSDGDGSLVRVVPHKAGIGDPSNVQRLINKLASTLSGTSIGHILRDVDLLEQPGPFCDIVASLVIMPSDMEIKAEILEGTIERRLEIVTSLLENYLTTSQQGATLPSATKATGSLEEKYLRLLHERGAGEDTIKAIEQEIGRLASMNEMNPLYAGQKAYLDVVCSIPWNVAGDQQELSLGEVRRVLDSNHFGLADVKKRIVEYVAVKKMNVSAPGQASGPILLLVGPPGTGKTSIARSIAECIGKKFDRISLGGVRDEAEIRGHRRTYIGSFPGKIVNVMRRTGVSDPLILIDEVDKVANNSGRGDVSAALLELLDPEQNTAFKDAYVDVPVDMSRATFICTANSLDAVPGPLVDRCEVVELSSYTLAEKRVIARRHLLPDVLRQCGLRSGSLTLTNEAIDEVILEYTREAGVRSLRKALEAVVRHKIVSYVENGSTAESIPDKNDSEIGANDIRDILGPPRFSRPNAPACTIGSATGLVWTPAGGACQLVECLRIPNGENRGDSPSSGLVLTGSAGDVLHESAIIALSWLRANRDRLTRDRAPAPNGFQALDSPTTRASTIHIHLPAGAVPKDGPSAGITILVALFSLQTGEHVRPMMAFTGELSLLGHVLPVGGIKEKLIAAHTAGIRAVVLPEKNLLQAKQCLAEEHLEADMRLIPVSFADQVLEAAFVGLPRADSQAHLASRM